MNYGAYGFPYNYISGRQNRISQLFVFRAIRSSAPPGECSGYRYCGATYRMQRQLRTSFTVQCKLQYACSQKAFKFIFRHLHRVSSLSNNASSRPTYHRPKLKRITANAFQSDTNGERTTRTSVGKNCEFSKYSESLKVTRRDSHSGIQDCSAFIVRSKFNTEHLKISSIACFAFQQIFKL